MVGRRRRGRARGQETYKHGRRKAEREQGESGSKGSSTKRGESCVKTKTKTKTGLVTATVGAAGLVLSLGPPDSHPQEAGPLQPGRGWLVNLGSGEGGLGECWTAEDLAPWPGQIMGRSGGGRSLSPQVTQSHSTEHGAWHAAVIR